MVEIGVETPGREPFERAVPVVDHTALEVRLQRLVDELLLDGVADLDGDDGVLVKAGETPLALGLEDRHRQRVLDAEVSDLVPAVGTPQKHQSVVG